MLKKIRIFEKNPQLMEYQKVECLFNVKIVNRKLSVFNQNIFLKLLIINPDPPHGQRPPPKLSASFTCSAFEKPFLKQHNPA